MKGDKTRKAKTQNYAWHKKGHERERKVIL